MPRIRDFFLSDLPPSQSLECLFDTLPRGPASHGRPSTLSEARERIHDLIDRQVSVADLRDFRARDLEQFKVSDLRAWTGVRRIALPDHCSAATVRTFLLGPPALEMLGARRIEGTGPLPLHFARHLRLFETDNTGEERVPHPPPLPLLVHQRQGANTRPIYCIDDSPHKALTHALEKDRCRLVGARPHAIHAIEAELRSFRQSPSNYRQHLKMADAGEVGDLRLALRQMPYELMSKDNSRRVEKMLGYASSLVFPDAARAPRISRDTQSPTASPPSTPLSTARLRAEPESLRTVQLFLDHGKVPPGFAAELGAIENARLTLHELKGGRLPEECIASNVCVLDLFPVWEPLRKQGPDGAPGLREDLTALDGLEEIRVHHLIGPDHWLSKWCAANGVALRRPLDRSDSL